MDAEEGAEKSFTAKNPKDAKEQQQNSTPRVAKTTPRAGISRIRQDESSQV